MFQFSKRAAVALAVAAVAMPALAQDNPINQLGWLAGMWRADAMGGQVEDVWTPATNGEMLSTMKMMQGGKVGRYEFRSIRMIDGKLTFQELGFGGDMKAAAGPPLSPLTTIEGKHAVFGTFVFENTGPNTMTVTIQRPNPQDPSKPIATKINYTRAFKFTPG